MSPLRTYRVVTVWEFAYEVEAESPEAAEALDDARGIQDWNDAIILRHYIQDAGGTCYVPEGYEGPET